MSLSRWLFALRSPAPIRSPEDTSAQRGKAVLESSAVDCPNCYGGASLSNNEGHDLGTGGMFQVPSLVGIGAPGDA
ncbi:MAG: hypothetical protein OEZ06_27265 [Myxococcales bacterium]|nr:hypothetical protein [Myxococcales bacterium]